ncbi:MAG: response regulator [Phreatobacter sp.]|nr:response regulator [Phreatobacter sp.]
MTIHNPVLIVEDQPILLLDLESGLEEGGYAVLAARNAEEAMAILETELEWILALVTDIDLGVTGVNGWDVADKARNVKPELPVIYMTGASADEWASRGVPRSILLPKPFAMAQVIRAIDQLLDTSIEPLAPR